MSFVLVAVTVAVIVAVVTVDVIVTATSMVASRPSFQSSSLVFYSFLLEKLILPP